MSIEPIDLPAVGPDEVSNFRIGKTLVFVNGRHLTGVRLLLWRAHQKMRGLTRWWRPRTVVTAIDVENGIVTLAVERWSWGRWRWERSA